MSKSANDAAAAASDVDTPPAGAALPRRPRRPIPTVPRLSSLCLDVISTKLERYPPSSLGMLSESEWENVVRRRHRKTAPRNQGGAGASQNAAAGKRSVGVLAEAKPPPSKGGLDGSGRITPAISSNAISAIEEACPHLSISTVVDNLIWKDCVEYKFKTGGQSRPRGLQYPWDISVERLRRSGDELLALLKPPSEGIKTGAIKLEEDTEGGGGGVTELDPYLMQKRYRTLDRAIQILSESPMNVPLLKASGVGKAVGKFIKQCGKVRARGEGGIPLYMVNVWEIRSTSPTVNNPTPSLAPIENLEDLRQSWMDVASSSGVAMSGCRLDTGDDAVGCSGRDKMTTVEQHQKDMVILQACKKWRHLYKALGERETNVKATRGARIRQIRENLETNRHKVGRIHTKLEGRPDERARKEAILNGSRGARARAIAAGRGQPVSGGSGKMQQIRAETKVASSRRVGVGNNAPDSERKPNAAFGFSVANSNTMQRKQMKPASFGASVAWASTTKRKIVAKPQEIALRGGKKMKLARAASSLQQQRQRANSRR